MADTSELKQNFLDSCLNGHVEDVLKYLERGVNVNITDTLGRTALMLACLRPSNGQVITILLQNDINVYALDKEGNSALDYARQNNNLEAEKLLRQSHPDKQEPLPNGVKSYDPSIGHYVPKQQSNVDELLEQRALEAVIATCDEFKSLEGTHRPFVYFKKSEALFQLGRHQEAVKVLHITKQIFNEIYGDFESNRSWSKEVKELYLKIISIQADIDRHQGGQALWLYNEAYQLSTEPEQKYEFKQLRDEMYARMVRSFDYDRDKKVALIEENLPFFEPNYILPLLIDDLGNLEFPEGIPQKKTLYVVHPHHNRTFFPYKGALYALFNAKLNELLNLVQALGAIHIKIEYLQGHSHLQQAQDPVFDDKQKDKKGQNKDTSNFVIEQQFNPVHKVHLPAQMIWYNHRPEWQNLAKQRLQGSLANAEILLSTENIILIPAHEIEEIEEELQELVSFGYERSGGRSKKRGKKAAKEEEEKAFTLERTAQEKIVCKVSIAFEAKEKLTKEVEPGIFTNLNIEIPRFTETREEVDSDAVLKKKNKNNLFEKQAKESIEYSNNKIEQKQPSHTSSVRQNILVDEATSTKTDEKEVVKVEDNKEVKETKVVKKETKKTTPKEEATVKREREVKLKEVDLKEKLPKKDAVSGDIDELTQEERYYYEMLQHAYQDGNISDDVRKVLERRRSRFKISLERASEIEKMMLERKSL